MKKQIKASLITTVGILFPLTQILIYDYLKLNSHSLIENQLFGMWQLSTSTLIFVGFVAYGLVELANFDNQ